MATLTVNTIGRAGVDPAGVAVAATAGAGGDIFPNTGSEFVWINNGGGSPITVTLTVTATLDGQVIANKTLSIVNAHAALVGPFPTGTYSDGSGNVKITYSSVTSVTIAALKLGS